MTDNTARKLIIGILLGIIIFLYGYITIDGLITTNKKINICVDLISSVYTVINDNNNTLKEKLSEIDSYNNGQDERIKKCTKDMCAIIKDKEQKFDKILENVNKINNQQTENIDSLNGNIETHEDNFYNVEQEIAGQEKAIEYLNYITRSTETYIDSQEVVNRILRTSVIIYGNEGMGSGTIIGKTREAMYVLTCRHVVADILEAKNPNLKAFVGYSKYKTEGNKYISEGQLLYTADIIKESEEKDLAILRVNYVDDNLQIATLSFTEPVKGDVIYTVGNPLGVERTISKGMVANIFDEYYMTDGTMTYGNSGGGLYNVRGELIGVPARVPGYNALVTTIPESGLGMSINLKIVKEFIEGVI